jgi:arylformamidase
VNISTLSVGSHTGTHIDAPKHFIKDGIAIDQILPKNLIGEAYVADLSRVPFGDAIEVEDLEPELDGKMSADDIVICYTGCSEHWGEESFNSDYTYLTRNAAEYLVSKRARGVGIDFLSIERFGSPEPVAHRELLGHGIFIIESLSKATKEFLRKRILLICLPLKLEDGDAAPARVLAVPIIAGRGP